jgi:predicted nucleic acid-binding Zn ribbon protein
MSKHKFEKGEETCSIPAHMHCFSCGKAIPFKEDGDPFCGKDCKTTYEKTYGKRRKILLTCLAVPLSMIILLLVARMLHFI